MGPQGRSRKPGARERNGRPSRSIRDPGTPELQARREWLAARDPARSVYPLGILLANDEIPESWHQAGCKYAWLHAVVYGRMSMAAVKYEQGHRHRVQEIDDADQKKWQALLRRIDGELSRISRQHRDAVVNFCVYGRVPEWLGPAFRTLSDVRDSTRLRQALKQLARAVGLEAREESEIRAIATGDGGVDTKLWHKPDVKAG